MLKKLLAILIAALPVGCSAAQQTINVGTPDAGNGDTLRSAFVKVNSNFDEVYSLAVSRAESFGAVADDGLDDYAAITNALATIGTVYLGPGQYDTSLRIMMGSNQRLIGAGKELTTLRLMDGSPGYASISTNSPQSKYHVIRSEAPSTNITVRGLTVDGNMSNQTNTNWAVHFPAIPTKPITLSTIALGGGALQIDDVKAIGWGAGSLNNEIVPPSTNYNYSEVFPILISDWGVDPALVDSGVFPRGLQSRITGCEVTTPCYDYSDYDLTYPGADASLIVAHISYGSAIVENNYIHDIGLTDTIDGSGWSSDGQLLGITLYGTNLIARDNLIKKFYGSALWCGDTWTNRNITYANNVIDGARVGFRFYESTANASFFNGVTITGNRFRNYGTTPSSFRLVSKLPLTTGNVVQSGFEISGYFNISNLVVMDNVFDINSWTNTQAGPTEKQAVIGNIYPYSGAKYSEWSFFNNWMSAFYGGDQVNSATRVDWYSDNLALNHNLIAFGNNRDAEGGTVYMQDRNVAYDAFTNVFDDTLTVKQLPGSRVARPADGTHTIFYDSEDDYLKYKKDTGGLYKLVHTQPDGNTFIDGRISMLGNQPVKWGNGMAAAGIAAGTTNDYIGLSLGWNGNHHALLDIIGETNTAWVVRSPGFVNNSGDTNGVFLIMVNSDGTMLRDNHGKLTFGNNTYHSGDANLQNNDITNVQNMSFTPGPMVVSASGSPESNVTAPVGSLYLRTDGGAGTSFYVKESGSGNTGWVAK